MDLNKKIWQWAAVIVMSLCWGSSFILIKKSLIAYTPYQSGSFRIVLAFLFFLPFAIKRLKKINKKNFLPLFVIGFIGNLLPAFMFAYGETLISSSLASMLNSTTPIFVLIIGLLFFKTKMSFFKILGLFIGFVGTLGLILTDFSSILNGWNIGAFVILIATFFYGINTNLIKKNVKKLDGLTVAALSFFFIGPIAIVYFLSTDLSTIVQNPSFIKSTISLVVLAFLGSFFAIIIFNLLVKYTTAIFAASTTYFMPIVAIMWGLIDNEKITEIQIISIAIVLTGVSLVNKKEKTKPLVVEKK